MYGEAQKEEISKGLIMFQELNLPVFPCKGKKPLIRDWTNRYMPTSDEINAWIEKYPDMNVGMTLGVTSGLVGIDVDGKAGYKILEMLSKGDLPKTWQFSTPSGGMRYLYRIPANETILKKFTQADPSEMHSECALLGEGQMTIMPPSIGENGANYDWINHPNVTKLAEAPGWMVQKMNKGGIKNRKTNSHPDTKPLDTLRGNCPAFKEDWEIQREQGLDNDSWYSWSSLLTNAGYPDAAELFSKASLKHNNESKNRLEKLKQNSINGLTRCMTIGCNEEQVRQCFKNEVRWSKEGKIQNSPGYFLIRPPQSKKWTPTQLEDIGFQFYAKNGKLAGINGNIFARHLLQQLDLLYVSSGQNYYMYEKGIWIYVDYNNLSRKLREILHSLLPDIWTSNLEASYMEALKVEAPRVESLDSDKGYINLENGMLSLNDFQLIPHDKSYYSSIRVPIIYNSTASCPQFMRFLSDIFEGDKDRIALIGEVLGYCITAENQAHKAILFFGRGSNGKSVLADVLANLCGIENVSSVPLQELDNAFARYELVDKLVNLATENEVSKDGLNTQYFKSIVSGDPIRVEKKYEQGFTYKPFCKLVFALNNLPYSRDKSFGFERRLLIVPFNRTFSKDERDPRLIDKLKMELPGILNFALEGLKRLRKNNYEFSSSKAVDEAVEEYTETLNPLRRFVLEKIVSTKSQLDKVSHQSLVIAYDTWCMENGHSSGQTGSSRAFIKNIKDTLKDNNIPFDKTKGGNKRYITHIKILVNEETDVDQEISIDDM
jgi:P4 family phage/plasmid primase-like protien